MSPPVDPVPTFNWFFEYQPIESEILTLPGRYKTVESKQSADEKVPNTGYKSILYTFIFQPNIINSYVVEKDGKITDFMSFYCLPSTVMNHPTHKNIKVIDSLID